MIIIIIFIRAHATLVYVLLLMHVIAVRHVLRSSCGHMVGLNPWTQMYSRLAPIYGIALFWMIWYQNVSRKFVVAVLCIMYV